MHRNIPIGKHPHEWNMFTFYLDLAALVGEFTYNHTHAMVDLALYYKLHII